MQKITKKRKHLCFYKIIHFSVQFSAKVNIFIVKTQLNSTFTNDLKENKKNRQMFIVADLVSLSRSLTRTLRLGLTRFDSLLVY